MSNNGVLFYSQYDGNRIGETELVIAHNKLVRSLELEYMNHICKLLKQKSSILNSLQKQFLDQRNKIKQAFSHRSNSIRRQTQPEREINRKNRSNISNNYASLVDDGNADNAQNSAQNNSKSVANNTEASVCIDEDSHRVSLQNIAEPDDDLTESDGNEDDSKLDDRQTTTENDRIGTLVSSVENEVDISGIENSTNTNQSQQAGNDLKEANVARRKSEALPLASYRKCKTSKNVFNEVA